MNYGLAAYIYVILVNIALGALAIFALPSGSPLIFVAEVFVVLSSIVGILLLNRFKKPLSFLSSASKLLKQSDFNSRLRQEQNPFMNELIDVYNHMLDTLHSEQLKLGEQREFFDKLLEATPVGIILFDFEGRISRVNPAARVHLGQEPTDLMGSTLAQLATPLAIAIDNNQDDSIVALSDNRRFKIQKSKFYDRGFRRDFVLVEELTRELDETERASFETLIRMVSHEVNNTIGATSSILEAFKEYQQDLPENERDDFTNAIDVIIRRSSNLAAFVKRFADVVYLPEPEVSETPLAPMINNCVQLFSNEFKNRDIDLVLEGFEASSTALLDAHMMEQALTNILKNAYEAIEKNGVITVAVEDMGTEFQLRIKDSAGALPLNNESKLFKPFYTSKPDGQGVGLMLVKEILQKHGFKYKLHCESDQWTEFSIDIPKITLNPSF